ncbi:MAG: sigma-70 family RNA polymerase sigma factor [Pirellulaceae bacterium]|nr:sigma-70 family RNA polymerase sigma factor [Pirellulaceae bacterium]
MQNDPSNLVEHCFRHEYGRLVALLTRALGVRNLELVEDVVQAALAKAIQAWARSGVPKDPAAWLYRTARNLAIDTIRRSQLEQRIVEENLLAQAFLEVDDADLNTAEVADAPLRFLFLCCHPSIPLESSVAIALKTVSGFSIEEIASAFLITKSNAEKRITRAKEALRKRGDEIADLNPHSMEERLEAVQSTIYLLFSEGYSSSSGDVVLRKDLCEEAIRLARMLLKHTPLAKASSAALLALMLMHTARFDARVDTSGAIVLLESQDRSRWNWTVIREAMDWMARSTESNQLSRFHIESAIAWEHCRAVTFEAIDWQRVIELYQALERLYPSPMVRLNLAIAWAYVAGPEVGLQRLIDIPESDRSRLRPWWDCAVAEAYHRLGKTAEATAHWTDALALTTGTANRELIARKLRT